MQSWRSAVTFFRERLLSFRRTASRSLFVYDLELGNCVFACLLPARQDESEMREIFDLILML